jgi:DNA-directed RNA polymerase subunit omega
MLYPSLASLLEKINSRYLLVNVIAHRAREIANEAEELGEPLDEKPVSIAIQEIADGKISVVAFGGGELN